MIKVEIPNRTWIMLVQAYALSIQAAKGNLEQSSTSMELFTYLLKKYSKNDMITLHSFIEKTQKDNQVQLTMTMNELGIKSDIEPLIKIVTH